MIYVICKIQVQQQVSKEYDQLKAIQTELSEFTMGMQNAPLQALRRNLASTEIESKDPGAWFRADPDIWSPPAGRDPDVFGPPVDRSLPPQVRSRMPPNKKLDNKRQSAVRPSARDSKGGQRKSGMPTNSARGTSRDSAKKGADGAQTKDGKEGKEGKDEENKEEEQEEEKKFEAANHMEGDLVDILGKINRI